jgi:anti-sigma factor RsiW
VSLRLDGELSQLEAALLDAHLAGCALCSAFAADVVATTGSLRVAALEVAPRLDVRVPRRVLPRVAPLVAAAACALAILVGGGIGLHGLVGRASLPRPTAMISSNEMGINFRNIRREQLMAEEHPIPRNKAFF